MSTVFREGRGGYCLRSASDNSKRLRSRVVPSSLNSDSRRSKLGKRECTKNDFYVEVRPYAKLALEFYNERAKRNYKLVESDTAALNSIGVAIGCIHHINFTAKKKHVADAPVELFFAELTLTGIGIRRVTTCQCLGPEKDILEAKTDIYGCCFFCKNAIMYHPRWGGFKTGLEKNGGYF